MLRSVLHLPASSSRLAAECRIVGARAPSSFSLRRLLSTPTPTSTYPAASPRALEKLKLIPVTERIPSEVEQAEQRASPGAERHAPERRHEPAERPRPSKTNPPTYAHLGDLPPQTTKVDIVKAVLKAGPTGRILALTLTPAGEGRHPTRAQASIEFDSWPSAERLFKLNGCDRFIIHGVRPFVKLQIKKGDPDTKLNLSPGHRTWDHSRMLPPSRVVLLRGRSADPRLEVKTIRQLLKDHDVPTETEMIEVTDYTETGRRVIAWRFCSWRYQARRAFKIFRTEISARQGQFSAIDIFYGPDPCDIVPPSESYFKKEHHG